MAEADLISLGLAFLREATKREQPKSEPDSREDLLIGLASRGVAALEQIAGDVRHLAHNSGVAR